MSTPFPSSPTLAGVNVCLIGPAGTGKTHSIGTLVDSGVETFVIMLEQGLESLLGYWTDRGKPIPENLHYHKLAAPTASFAEMIKNAELINTMGLDSLSKMTDPNKSKYNQFIGLLKALSDFTDDRTGKKYGAVNTWSPARALVIDGLTGLNSAAMQLVIGGKAVRSQSDWGIAQDQVEKILRMLCDACACHFVLIAHVEREQDPISGGVKLMPSTLGKALAPKISAMFSDVILATRQGDKWTWDTANPMADLKTRNLPVKADNAPDFRPIIEKWKSRGGVILPLAT